MGIRISYRCRCARGLVCDHVYLDAVVRFVEYVVEVSVEVYAEVNGRDYNIHSNVNRSS